MDRVKRRALLGRARAEFARRRHPRLQMGSGQIFYDAMPKLDPSGEIVLGDNVFCFNSPIPIQISARRGGRVVLGRDVGFSYGADLFAAESIEIGDATMIGSMVAIYDTNFHPVEEGRPTRTAPVKIGADAWLGRGAVVLPGVEIGDHSVIAAGSVVTGDIPARTIAVGNPAVPVRELKAGEGWRRNSEPN